MTKFDFCLVDSLEKVLPSISPVPMKTEKRHLFKNQRWSFQLAYTCENDDFGESSTEFTLRCSGMNKELLSLRQVDLVPCDYPCHGTWDDNYLTTSPGLLPDLLRPVEWEVPVKAIPAQWRSLWFTVDAQKLPAGQHNLRLEVLAPLGAVLAKFCLPVVVLEKSLPAQKLYHTQWFHADCLADYYSLEVFSEEHWRIISNFMESAAAHGINMLLTPVFTPPLDTAKGGERTTVQLVDVFWKDGKYTFDFSKLRRWVSMCTSHGITQIEVAHLFTQWGAEYAPKIMVHTENGLEQRFGWHTPAVDGEYTIFLRTFLPELKRKLHALVGLEHVWFHISDEPHDHEKASYAAAKDSISDLLENCHVIDALSSYEIYREGIVENPIISNDHLTPFIASEVSGLWTYYCTVQALKVPNRFIAMPSARNRIMGVLMYRYNIEGFLHWGFNFYNSQRSLRPIDPFRVTDAGCAFPSGDPFLVYPAADGTAYESIRGEVLKEALQDFRLLCLCEETVGRQRTLDMLLTVGGAMTFEAYPRDKKFFHHLWTAVMQILEEESNET